MSAISLSPKTAWANAQGLPKDVWKGIWIAVAAYVVLSVAFSLYYADFMSGSLLERIQQIQQTQNIQEQLEFPSGMMIGLFLLNLVLILTFYIVNRTVAAHDRQEAPTALFLLGGFLGRLVLPTIIAYLVLILGVMLIALVWGAFIGFLGLFLPQVIVIALGTIPFLLLPFAGLYAVIRLTCLISVIAFEDLSLYAAIKRTWALSSGNFWRIFGVVLVILVFAAAALIAMVLFELLTHSIFGQGSVFTVLQTVFQLILGLIFATVYFLLPVAIYRVLRDGETAEAAQA